MQQTEQRKNDKAEKFQKVKKAIHKVKDSPTAPIAPKHIKLSDSTHPAEEIKAPAEAATTLARDNFRDSTISIALPASIVINSQSGELQTYLVGQIARAASIFRIEEIIIINDCTSTSEEAKLKRKQGDATNFFVKNLEYMETPQYLRKALFPVIPELKYTGLMNPLDAPHHLRQTEWSTYREGVVIPRPVRADRGSWVNIGLKKDCQIQEKLAVGTRVTVRINEKGDNLELKYYTGNVVSQLEPKQQLGKYWGYSVRVASGIWDALKGCPYPEGKYDLMIGTSDRGETYRKLKIKEANTYKHALIMFGGLPGIEGLIDGDENAEVTSEDAPRLFEYYVNTCPDQGCRTIRTEVLALL